MSDSNSNEAGCGRRALIGTSLADKLGVLILTFLVMLVAVSFASGGLAHLGMSERTSLLASSALQNILCFIFPAWLAAFLCSSAPAGYLGADSKVNMPAVFAAVLALLLFIPAINYVVYWNEHVRMPAAMSGFEELMRRYEERAAVSTAVLLGDYSVWGLLSGVLLIGVLTGIGEEAFFRAGLQKAMTSSGVNPHVSVWTVAVIFSAIHFQFFGFVPRLLLGALFGYIYWRSGSLWLSAGAHALNNSLVVVAQWLAGNGYYDLDIDKVGTWGPDEAWASAGATLLAVVALIGFWKFTSSKSESNGKEGTGCRNQADNR